MSRIFIERPIFAWVLAIVTMLLGVGAIRLLPIEQYPDIAPAQINIRANYPGASAETIENSVTQVLEQQLTGIDGLLYFSSSSSSRGQVSISAVFEKGVNPDIAQVQVQNKVQQALSRLPQQVQQQGLTVTKSSPDILMTVVVYDETNQRTNRDVTDYLTSNIQDRLARLPGVGETNVFGSPYAMRIWLDPVRLASTGLMPGDVIAAVQAQNTEIAAGEIGAQPQPESQMLSATVTAKSRLQTPEQFRQIIVKARPDGAVVRLADVARVELGSENYNVLGRMNGHPGGGLAVFLAPGADALAVSESIKAMMEEAAKSFPAGFKHAYTVDSTDFIRLSIDEVIVTLIEAIILVVIVMFVFLQSWRATLVPAIAVPVVLLGTLAILYVAGFTINTLTMFGLVLAIGLLVDDAIVVVENVERLLEENSGMSPREATIRSMKEISVALVAIAVVLSAVFVPMAFFGGSTGVIYRQFSITIVSAMVLSVLVALILSPALTANLLRARSHEPPPENHKVQRLLHRWGEGFNRRFARMTEWFVGVARSMAERKWRYLAIYAGVCLALVLLFLRLPTGFLPVEDQGGLQLQFRLPPGATQARTGVVQRQIEQYFGDYESENIATLFTAAGGGGAGASGQNTGQGFIKLKHWDERPGAANGAEEIAARASKAFSAVRDAQVFVLVPPAVRGLGQSTGFTMELLNSSGLSREEFAQAKDRLLDLASQDERLTNVRLSQLPDVATVQVNIDETKVSALGLAQSDVNTTLAAAWGGRYVNDFVDRGRVKRVYVQGDAPYRSDPASLDLWHVRGSGGQMVPFSSFANAGWSTSAVTSARFQGVPAFEFQGQAGPGLSTGEAMRRMEELAAQIPGTSIAWAGQSYQERLSSGQAPLLYGIALMVVFLCLAALYESWSVPMAVLLVIPLGLVGAVLAVTLRGLENDVFLQIGLLTTMGLASKNAILMIEFAERAEKDGKRIIDAALEAARLRLRPILMTSFAFIFGVLPLALSTGAGANARVAIGTSVIGGMLSATVLAVFYIPLFFVLVRRSTRDFLAKARHWRPLSRAST